ncbi:thiol:disulfide interchange protein DsbG [Salinisphaera aquimarina]|uniref:Thiol:disulfide interchange protein DsbG n=1 Tax=Salinisphaera aquimarina TaxID=2094031 RepID=A0ABV7ERQ4_9GAMM
MKRRDVTDLAPIAQGLVLAFGLTITTVWPAWSAPASNTHYPKVLQDMVDAGKTQVMKQFPTDKNGLTGYLVEHRGYQTVVYGEDGYLMLGPLYDPQGHNLSKQYARKYKPKPDVGKVIHSLDADRMVTEGSKDAPTLYVFADPNCIYCHHLYQQVEPLVKAGRLRIHWIMVGVLGPSSVGRAATILKAKDPAADLARNESNFDVQHEQGGIAVGQPKGALGRVLKTNRQAMFDVGGSGTPTVLFRGRGGHWHEREGMPPKGWLDHYADRPRHNE